LLSKIKRTASILIEPKKVRKNSEVSFFFLTNAKKRNELFRKYRSFDIATVVTAKKMLNVLCKGGGGTRTV
jgi:hypothetical protein